MRSLGRRTFGLMAAILLFWPSRSEPCSICRCGDPTFNALGKEGYTAQGWRFALDSERFDKGEGGAEHEAEMTENRVTAMVSYGFADRFAIVARLPVSFRNFKEIHEGAAHEELATRGLSDPEIHAQARVWASGFSGGLGRRTSLSLIAGVKVGLGENDHAREGERVDEHAQPGTGSTDLLGGLAGVHLIDKRSALFASVQYRHTGENDAGYRYGRMALANVAYERKLASRLDGVLELNYRFAGKDREAEEVVMNTGGSLLYVTPRLLVDVGSGVVLRAAAQVPAVRRLNGSQKEKVVVNAGLSFHFGPR